MPLIKSNLSLSFSAGLDQKSDPWQLSPGSMLTLVNVVFSKTKQFAKRYGFAKLTSLPAGASASTITTYAGNLVAIGTNLYAFGEQSNQWSSKGRIQPLQLSVQPMVRTAYSQTAVDSAITSSGLACVVFLDGDGNNKYTIIDSITGQSLVPITALPSGALSPRVFVLGNYFVITFLITVTATPHLQYIAVPLANPASPGAATDLSTSVLSTSTGYDGATANGYLYIAWNGSDGGNALRVSYLSSTLIQGTTSVITTLNSALISVCCDTTSGTPVIWVSGYNSGTHLIKSLAFNQSLTSILGATTTLSSTTITQLTSTAQSQILTLFYEVSNTYSFSATRSDLLGTVTCTQAGAVGSTSTIARSVGLASKAFLVGTTNYMLAAYAGTYQPSYFLLDGSGNVVAKLAYSNGGGYVTGQVLPSIALYGTKAQLSYLFKDSIQSVNKSQGVTAPAGIYAQTGINLVSFNFAPGNLSTAEIGGSLHIAGGFLWQYDGIKPVEHNFHLWPEDLTVSTSTSGGNLTAQQYYYQVCYEWTDGAGMIHRSAPSVPVTVTTTGATSSNTLNIPTIRLTYKVAPNAIRIVIYRWSAGQQSYYQVTSVSSPTLNNPAADSISFVDTLADSSIIGNSLIYTTGNVAEDIAAPACNAVSLFKSRLVLIPAEDTNAWWYSKQVIEGTPVEMSDLFTEYVAPTIGSQGSSGASYALAPLDDKLTFFKKDAIYYVVGSGPDNTGANNDFSDPVFITSTVGSSKQQSLTFIPQGLLFQSNKGWWLLGRDLSTSYIGAPVEGYNTLNTLAASTIPGVNQVRLLISGGQLVSGTLYQSLHTVLDSSGNVCQETSGNYVDGTVGTMLHYDYYYGQWSTFQLQQGPVLIGFASAWFNLAGLQGYERAYYFYLLGQYLTPHKLAVSIAYDYNSSPEQTAIITPDNYALPFGSDPYYGSTDTMGGDPVEQWRVFLTKQRCQSFQIQLQEIYDPSYGTVPGAGLTFSGLNLIVGMKKAYRPISSSRSTS